jgi:hypothetical protein
MQLDKIQSRLLEAITDPDKAEAEDLDSFISSDQISREERLAIYRNNHIKGLTNILISTFPLIEKIVGRAFMTQMSAEYIKKNLPDKANMNLYGKDFPEFIKNNEPAHKLPYLYDIAQMEWLWNEAYYAPEHISLDPNQLLELNEEDFYSMRLKLGDSVRLMQSKFSLIKIRTFLESDEPKEKIKYDSHPSNILISKINHQVQVTPLSDAEFLFLKGIKKGAALGDITVTISNSHTNFKLDEVLQKHFTLGTFDGYEV